MQPYQGDYSYASLKEYMAEAEDILAKRSNKTVLQADAQVSAFIREHGKEELMQLKRDNYNLNLEDCVVGANQQKMLDVVDGHIVPRSGLVFLTPHNRNGRAPFYSSVKIVGSRHVKTLWFNLAVMLLMCVITASLLLTDCPGKYVRKEAQ